MRAFDLKGIWKGEYIPCPHLPTFFILLHLFACGPAREGNPANISEDYFYGAWADTTENGGFIFDPEGNFYLIFDGNITSGDYPDSIQVEYKLHLDVKPIELELIARRISDDSIVKQGKLCTLEPVDSTTMNARLLNDPTSKIMVLRRSETKED